jgi:hypothetical protein
MCCGVPHGRNSWSGRRESIGSMNHASVRLRDSRRKDVTDCGAAGTSPCALPTVTGRRRRANTATRLFPEKPETGNVGFGRPPRLRFEPPQPVMTRRFRRRLRWGVFAALVVRPATWLLWTWLFIGRTDMSFQSGGLTLRGMLIDPRFRSRTPTIVMAHGSGSASRNSLLPYAYLFASRGYTALAYDKRGAGASDGGPTEWRELSFDSLARDLAAAYRFLETHPRVDTRRIGVFALSQPAWVAARATSMMPPPAFVIMVSASVSTVAEDRLFGRAAGIPYDAIEMAHAGQTLQYEGGGMPPTLIRVRLSVIRRIFRWLDARTKDSHA